MTRYHQIVLFYFVFQSFHLEWIILPNTNNPHSSFSLCLLSSCPTQKQTFPLSPPRLASIVYPIPASDMNLCLYLHGLFVTLQLISRPFLIEMQLIQVVGLWLTCTRQTWSQFKTYWHLYPMQAKTNGMKSDVMANLKMS